MSKKETFKTGQTDKRYKSLISFIENWGVSKDRFAREAGINPTTFRHKLTDRWPYKFSEEDYLLIKRTVRRMLNDSSKTMDAFSDK